MVVGIALLMILPMVGVIGSASATSLPVPRVENIVSIGASNEPYFTDYLDAKGGSTEHPSGQGEWGVADYQSNTFSIFNGSSEALTYTVRTSEKPLGVEADDQTQTFWVTDYNPSGNGAVTVIDGDNGTVLKTIPVGAEPARLCYDRANELYFVLNSGSNNITVINSSTYQVMKWGPGMLNAIPDGIVQPFGCAFNDHSNHLFVSDQGSDLVNVIDGTTLNYVANATNSYGSDDEETISGDSSTTNVYIANYGAYFTHGPHVLNPATMNLSVMGIANNTVWKGITLPDCLEPYGSGIDYVLNEVYVDCSGNDNVSVVDEATNAVVFTLNLPANSVPYGSHGYDPNQGTMIVSLDGLNAVAFVSDGTNGCLVHGTCSAGGGSPIIFPGGTTGLEYAVVGGVLAIGVIVAISSTRKRR